MSIDGWKRLDPSSSIVIADGYPLEEIQKLRNKPQYTNPLEKCSLLKFYLQRIDHLPSPITTYAEAKLFQQIH